MSPRTETLSVKYNFTNEELLEISRQMARKRQDVIEIENDEKQIKSEYKAKKDAAQAEIDMRANWVNSGYKMNRVECVLKKDAVNGMIFYVAKQTGEIVDSRKMRADEYQLDIDDM